MKLISGGWPSKFNGFRYGRKEHVIGPFQTMELNFSLSVQMHARITFSQNRCLQSAKVHSGSRADELLDHRYLSCLRHISFVRSWCCASTSHYCLQHATFHSYLIAHVGYLHCARHTSSELFCCSSFLVFWLYARLFALTAALFFVSSCCWYQRASWVDPTDWKAVLIVLFVFVVFARCAGKCSSSAMPNCHLFRVLQYGCHMGWILH